MFNGLCPCNLDFNTKLFCWGLGVGGWGQERLFLQQQIIQNFSTVHPMTEKNSKEDFSWTTGVESSEVHENLIDRGAFGEVHKV